MTYTKKNVLLPELAKKDEEITAYVETTLKDDADSDKERKVKELSHMLRSKKNPQLAMKVAELLYDKFEKPDNLNFCLVAAVDAGDTKKIEQFDKEAEQWVKNRQTEPEQKTHLYATRLKAANRLTNDAQFERVYAEIPDEDKVGNNYIVNQYYIYLNRNKRYQEIVRHYNSLNPAIKADELIKKHYNNALKNAGIVEQDSSVFLIGGDSADLSLPETVLQSLRVRVIKVKGSTVADILKKMEEDTSESRFAVVYGTEIDNGTRFDDFAWGYFFGKVGASHLVVLSPKEEGEEEIFISHSSFEKPQVISLTKLDDCKNKLAKRMQDGGLKVYQLSDGV